MDELNLTLGELIDELKKYPPETKVLDVTTISYNEEDNVIGVYGD